MLIEIVGIFWFASVTFDVFDVEIDISIVADFGGFTREGTTENIIIKFDLNFKTNENLLKIKLK